MPRDILSGPVISEHFSSLSNSALTLSLTVGSQIEDDSDVDNSDEDHAYQDQDQDQQIQLDFLLLSIHWASVAEHFDRVGPRGPYNQVPKSIDFFFVCLSAPDRFFRHMFRYATLYITAALLIINLV